MSIRLSILDQSPVFEQDTPERALRYTVELARRADRLGYHRFWVSEHHDSRSVAGSSPEVLISYLLASTERIRIGSGGVMLQHYSPYKVAENFNVLANLEPGRLDLGVGRAPGGLPRSTLALRRGAPEEDASLSGKLEELRNYLHGVDPGEGDPLAGLRAEPVPEQPARLYVLGASADSADLAARLGLPYVFSLFIGGDLEQAVASLQRYRSNFVSAAGSRPEGILSVSAAVAETDEEAVGIAVDNDLYRATLASGRKITTVGGREQAEEFGIQSGEAYTIEHIPSPLIKGSAESVGRRLREAAERSGAEELIITSPIFDFAKRVRSFELIQAYFAETQQAETTNESAVSAQGD